MAVLSQKKKQNHETLVTQTNFEFFQTNELVLIQT